MSEVEIFDLVYTNKITRFPPFFWDNEDAKKYAPDIIRHLIEDILKWSDEEIKKELRKETFNKNCLGGMMNTLYQNSPYKAIISAYPERNYKLWDFVNTPNDYWRGENGKEHAYEAMKWLIEEKLKWSYDDIRNKLNHQVFKDNNLHGMLKIAYHSSLFEAVDALYPGVFEKWELGEHVANDYWIYEKGIRAIKWLVEEKLKWNKKRH